MDGVWWPLRNLKAQLGESPENSGKKNYGKVPFQKTRHDEKVPHQPFLEPEVYMPVFFF